VRNRWTIERETVLRWRAMLPRDRVEDLTLWQRFALRYGEELAVYRVVAASDIDFDRAAHGPLDDFLDAHPDLDAGTLLLKRQHTATARLAFVNAAGSVVEEDVTDLGAVLAAAPFEAPVRHRPPLRVRALLGAADATRVPVSISTCSDIWLPWSSARYEEGAESEDFADNTALAHRHTPRLNTFLTRLRGLTLQLGGTWELDRDVTNRDLFFEVDDHGVLLDAENPLARISDERVWGLRRDDVLGALRSALCVLSLDPQPPPYHAVIRATVNRPDHELYAADRARVLDALRRPTDPSTRLARDELHEVAKVEVDNAICRHTFDVNEIVG